MPTNALGLATWLPDLETQTPNPGDAVQVTSVPVGHTPDTHFTALGAGGAGMPITLFSPLQKYLPGDLVVYSGNVYRALGTVPPGPFNPVQWAGITNGVTYLGDKDVTAAYTAFTPAPTIGSFLTASKAGAVHASWAAVIVNPPASMEPGDTLMWDGAKFRRIASSAVSTMHDIGTIAELRAAPIAGKKTALVAGYWKLGDGGGGVFHKVEQAVFSGATTGTVGGLIRTLTVNSVSAGVIHPGMAVYVGATLIGTILSYDSTVGATTRYVIKFANKAAANVTSTAFQGRFLDDGGLYIVPTGGDGSAAWVRETDGEVTADVGWYGPFRDGVNDDAPAWNAALAKVAYSGGKVTAPKDNYFFKTPVVLSNEFFATGASPRQFGGARTIEIDAYGSKVVTSGAIYALEIRDIYKGRSVTVKGFYTDQVANRAGLGGIMVWNAKHTHLVDCYINVCDGLRPEYAGITIDSDSYYATIDGCSVAGFDSSDGIAPTGVLIQGVANGARVINSNLGGSKDHIVITNSSIKLENASITPQTVNIVGKIAGQVLTVTSKTGDAILLGTQLAGPGVAAGTEVVTVNADGTYKVNISQTVAAGTAIVGTYGLLSTTTNDFTTSNYLKSILGFFISSTNYTVRYSSRVPIVDNSMIRSGPYGSGPYTYVVNKSQTVAPRTLYATYDYIPNSVTIDGCGFEQPITSNGVRVYRDLPGKVYTASGLTITKCRYELIDALLMIEGNSTQVQMPFFLAGNKGIVSCPNGVKNLCGDSIIINNLDATNVTSRAGPIKLSNKTYGLEFWSDAVPTPLFAPGLTVEGPLGVFKFNGYISNPADPTKPGDTLVMVGPEATHPYAYMVLTYGATSAHLKHKIPLQIATIAAANPLTVVPSLGEVYKHSTGALYTVETLNIAGGVGTIGFSVTATPPTSGAVTLTKISPGSGDATINFTAPTAMAAAYKVSIESLTGTPSAPVAMVAQYDDAFIFRFNLGQGISFASGYLDRPEYGHLGMYDFAGGTNRYHLKLAGNAYKLNVGNVIGLSSTTKPARNFKGSVTGVTNKTQIDVRFLDPEPDADYMAIVDLAPTGVTGAPKVFSSISNKTINGFTINAEVVSTVDMATGQIKTGPFTGSANWMIIR